MTTPLLTTKFFIPRTQSELVPRQHLIERLNKGLEGKLTLISAPAGFGKTTLASEWVDNLRLNDEIEYQIAWLSLDNGENDPARFLTYFITALNQVEGSTIALGQESLTMIQSPQLPPIESILIPLINEIANFPGRIILILDDYHVIESSQVDAVLTFLLDNFPPQMHLVIVTREDPHLPLSLHRTRSQLTEIRAADMRFTLSEASEFLTQVMGLDLSAADITALETRTEGWIVGLQLAAISLQGRDDATSLIESFTGSHRLVLDYLIEEVLKNQAENVQTFLLQTAILDRLTGTLCDALTGQDNGQEILEMLEQKNLFIVPLDDERHWYRYHHLFADLLHQRLRHTQLEQQVILHRRASEWFEQQGFVNEAIEHALSGEHFERAAYLIENHFGDKYLRVDPTILRRWLAEIPEKIVFSKPPLCILHAWNLFTNGHLDAAYRSLQIVEKILDPNTDQELVSSPDKDHLSDNNRMKLLGRIAAIRSFIVSYSGDIPSTIMYARQALEQLPDQELEWRSVTLITLGDAYANDGQMAEAHEARSNALLIAKVSGDPYVLVIINLRLAEILRQQGKLQQVIDICEHQSKEADKSGISESTVVGWLLGVWGEVLAELNDMNGALDKVNRGVELASRGRDVTYISFSTLSLVRVLFSSGDVAGAEDAIRSMENTTRDYDLPISDLSQLSAWSVRIWLAQGNLDLASKWVGEHELDLDGDPVYLQEMEYIAFARILIAQGKLDEAARLLQQLGEAAQAGGRTTRLIEILLLQALAFQVQENTADAISILDRALSLAEPEGFIRIFVDEGSPIEALIKKIKPEDERMKKYLRKLRAAFSYKELHPASLGSQPLIEPLSEREIDVLQLIAEGLTNQEIASRLFLSLNTVKVHNRNIYAKLGTHNRTTAVAKARELGVLTSD